MKWIVTQVRWIMLVSGLLTCTMLYAAVAPAAALESTFGVALQGAVAEIVVRNWGALITLVGAMLVYGAFDPPSRPLILTVSGLSKLIFIGLVLFYGREYLAHQAGFAIVVDLVAVVLFAGYLIGARRQPVAA
jgi:hypothetical protein